MILYSNTEVLEPYSAVGQIIALWPAAPPRQQQAHWLELPIGHGQVWSGQVWSDQARSDHTWRGQVWSGQDLSGQASCGQTKSSQV